MTATADLSVVEETLRDVAGAIAPGRWTMTTELTPESRRRGWTVHLKPHSNRGASVRVHVAESLPSLDVALGEGGLVELLPEEGEDGTVYAALRELVELVLRGRYSETLWYVGDRLVRSRGMLDHGDRVEVTRYRDLLPSLGSRSRRLERCYEPY
jgi:hypothetical protein